MRFLHLSHILVGLTSVFGAASCASSVDTRSGAGGASYATSTGGAQTSTAAPTKCTQGETQFCVGPGACRGGQSCDAVGVWSICDCGTQGSGGASTIGTFGDSSSVGGATGSGGASQPGGTSTLVATGGTSTLVTTGGTSPLVTTGGTSTLVATGGTSTLVATGGTSTLVATGGTTSSGGTSGIGGTVSAGGTTATSCVTSVQAASFDRLNLLLLLDKSGSMGDDPGGQWQNAASRWNPVVTTLRTFLQDQRSTGIFAALSIFPAEGDITSMCKVSSYEPPSTSSAKVPLTLLDDAGRQLFLARLCDPSAASASTCIKTGGGTPTRPALQGTIDYLTTVQQRFPESKTVIVFLTDGEPIFGYQQSAAVNALYSCDDLTNGCPLGPAGSAGTGTCATADGEVQKVADIIKTAPPRSIYVFGTGDLTSSTMNTWAAATGNPAVALQYISPTDTVASVKSALESIRSTHLSCNLKLPASAMNGAADPRMLNVTYIDAAGARMDLVQDPGCTHSQQWGWQYDNATNPTLIQLCQAACDNYLSAPSGHAEITFGCNARTASP